MYSEMVSVLGIIVLRQRMVPNSGEENSGRYPRHKEKLKIH